MQRHDLGFQATPTNQWYVLRKMPHTLGNNTAGGMFATFSSAKATSPSSRGSFNKDSSLFLNIEITTNATTNKVHSPVIFQHLFLVVQLCVRVKVVGKIGGLRLLRPS